MKIGEQIKKYRTQAKMSQRELGEKLGMSQQQIAQYESGKRMPKIDTINNIAGALNMGVRRLYPEFTMEEWKSSETYKLAQSHHTIVESMLNLMSLIYGDIVKIEEKSGHSSYGVHYKVIIDGSEYLLTIEDIDILIQFLKKNCAFMIESFNSRNNDS